MFHVKICGIRTVEDAIHVARSKADAIGLNFFEKSKRFVTPEQAKAISDTVGDDLIKVGVFVNAAVPNILETVKTAGIDVIQLHGDESPEMLFELEEHTSLPIIRAFRCRDGHFDEIVSFFQKVHENQAKPFAYLFDAYHPHEFGGTGQTLDPKTLRELIGQLRQTFGDFNWVLAGGLTPDNVGFAIRETRATSVDTASGVESQPGQKDQNKIARFADNAVAAIRTV